MIKKAYDEKLKIDIKYKKYNITASPYAYNDTYFVAYCDYANDLRKFRIDRIKSLKIGEKFNASKHLESEAKNKLKEVFRF